MTSILSVSVHFLTNEHLIAVNEKKSLNKCLGIFKWPLTTTVRTYVAVNPTSSDENLAGYGNFLTSLYFRVISISFLLGGNTRKSCFRKLEG